MNRLPRITVLGAGSWGLALADLLARRGCPVVVWGYDQGDIEQLTATGMLREKLPGFHLHRHVVCTHRLHAAVASAELLVLATPSQYLRAVLSSLGPLHDSVQGMVNVAKGIETGTLKRMSELIASQFAAHRIPIATLSGPSHAEELVVQMPTAVVVAGTDQSFVQQLQQLFTSGPLRVYTSGDLIGVELGGSLKNCIAIATGITDGLGLGDNTRGALVTRGLAEITRLGVALGARADTFYGLSGLGDLVTTCSSVHSRNRTVGCRIGKGERLEEIMATMTMVAEGVETTRSAVSLAESAAVDLPIIGQMYRVLFDGFPPALAVAELMGRPLKAELSS